ENYNIVMEFEKYAQDPNRLAVIWENEQGDRREITYKRLIENANKIGNIFLENGLKKGDKLLVMLPRLIDTYEVYIAALNTGIISIPSSGRIRTKDLQYRLTHGEVSGVVCLSDYSEEFTGIEQNDERVKFTVGASVNDWHHLDS